MIPEILIDRLASARSVVFFTGAGASRESGIPTFRDALTGLWGQFDAEKLATPEAFRRDPALVWGWYEWRRRQVQNIQPNAAHFAIASLESRIPEVTVITQNVDDLHERAGSQRVIHLHGSLFTPRCSDCGQLHALPSAVFDEPVDDCPVNPPACVACRGLIRPGVVWFNEELPDDAWQLTQDACRQADVFLSVGTSGLVWPAAELPYLAHLAGAMMVRVNPEPCSPKPFPIIDLVGMAGEILPAIVGSLDVTCSSQTTDGYPEESV